MSIKHMTLIMEKTGSLATGRETAMRLFGNSASGAEWKKETGKHSLVLQGWTIATVVRKSGYCEIWADNSCLKF